MLVSRGCLRAVDGAGYIRRHIAKTGRTIAGTPVWTRAEIEALRLHYPRRDGACTALRPRTWVAICHKARKLGLVRALRIWTRDEAELLRRLYPSQVSIDELLDRFPGKSKRQIWHKAGNLGVRRPRKPPRLTGHPLVDGVRLRAFALGYSMTELDDWTGSNRYFRDARYVNWRALQRAIDLMRGRIVIRWTDAGAADGFASLRVEA